MAKVRELTRRRVQKMFSKPSRTRTEFKEECDINRILERFRTQGVLEHVAKSPPRYGDVSEIPDFHQAQEIVRQAREAFGALDAGVRKRFFNDPGELLAFLQDPANEEEARRLGFLNPLQTAEPPKAAEAPAGAPRGPQGARDGGGAPEDASSSKKPPQEA